jgi:hypothetical protein
VGRSGYKRAPVLSAGPTREAPVLSAGPTLKAPALGAGKSVQRTRSYRPARTPADHPGNSAQKKPRKTQQRQFRIVRGDNFACAPIKTMVRQEMATQAISSLVRGLAQETAEATWFTGRHLTKLITYTVKTLYANTKKEEKRQSTHIHIQNKKNFNTRNH